MKRKATDQYIVLLWLDEADLGKYLCTKEQEQRKERKKDILL